MNPNHQVTWLKTRPSFSIECTRSTSTNRGYHESDYVIISEHELSPVDITRLDDCDLLGMGQDLRQVKHETFDDEVPPVVVDRRTGKRVECDCGGGEQGDGLVSVPHAESCASIPWGYNGQRFTKSTTYTYHRYDFLRICDSGD